MTKLSKAAINNVLRIVDSQKAMERVYELYHARGFLTHDDVHRSNEVFISGIMDVVEALYREFFIDCPGKQTDPGDEQPAETPLDKIEMVLWREGYIKQTKQVSPEHVKDFEEMGYVKIPKGEERAAWVQAEADRLATLVFKNGIFYAPEIVSEFETPFAGALEISDACRRKYPNIVEAQHGKGLTLYHLTRKD